MIKIGFFKMYLLLISVCLIGTLIGVRAVIDHDKESKQQAYDVQDTVVLTPIATISATPVASPTVAAAKHTVTGTEVAMINLYRKASGKRALTQSAALTRSANARAMAIYTGKMGWSHDGYITFIKSYYGPYFEIGENLAKEFSTFNSALVGWENSPTHNANLLRSFCEVGVGHYGDVWVAHFGSKTGSCN